VTFFYPDVSNHNAGLVIQPGTVAVCAKASEGVDYRDPTYPGFRSQVSKVGGLFMAYHWTWCANIAAEAYNAFGMVGPDTPMMWDVENTSRLQSVSGILALTDAYRKLGGLVTLCYLPRWYWQRMGSPDLRPLRDAGLRLVSSNYTSYADGGVGWDTYGGWAPYVWQYTDRQPYGGKLVDFNACQDSFANFAATVTRGLFTGGSTDMSEEQIPFNTERLANGAETWGRAMVTGEDPAHYMGGVGKGSPATAPNVLHEKLDALKDQVASVGGLSDTDRTLIKDLTDAVNALNSRLASP